MIRILFVCHGNICRSPMAEFVMRDLVAKRDLAGRFEIASAAVSGEETGNPVYPPARAALASIGISCPFRRARRITADDYSCWDYIIAMDRSNLRWLERILPSMDKTRLLLSYAGQDRDVADPWYTDDFDTCLEDIVLGCRALLDHIIREEGND